MSDRWNRRREPGTPAVRSRSPLRRLLLVVSTAQLGVGVAGQVWALRDGHPFDVAVLHWRGRPDRVGRDSWLFGTGLSAPVAMLVAQAGAIARLAAGPSRAATDTLGLLGAAMVPGYVLEHEFREATSAGGRDPVVTPLVLAGSALAALMAGIAVRDRLERSLGGAA
ncbi:hypothetical protein [Nocardioides mesophilus]|uniref:Uncharacterized protein n=1 Tax=Nocardioides mesophilus TaxID=433659 RepID=A0A7G9R6F1_9ACTN|nr:hypothetical protein [Nocardioides mesophilus]QNN51176.1 hypothetical protein H9L09_10965 [Nocardioides mesophilus]